MPSLGVPVNFTELCNIAVICEVSYRQAGLMPELSFGSHFFQDIVESGMFYVAVFDKEPNVVFHSEQILSRDNLLDEILPGENNWHQTIHLAHMPGLTLYSDIASQELIINEAKAFL